MQRNELQQDRKILIEHVIKKEPEMDVTKLLGHTLEEDPVLAVVPENTSLPRKYLFIHFSFLYSFVIILTIVYYSFLFIFITLIFSFNFI